MQRKIISIDETKCTGCGQCIPDCPEGALQLIDGKARLVSDLFCDGLGACIGTCPEGAISVIEREAVPYDEKAVMATIVQQGAPVIKSHLEHLAGHGEVEFYNEAVEFLIEHGTPIPDHIPPERKPARPPAARHGEGSACPPAPHASQPFAGCPGAAARSIPRAVPRQPVGGTTDSALRQWPVQLSLLNPAAPYFDNADLLVAADCTPFAYAGFHAEFLRGRIVIIFCPKLDPDIGGYIEKLAEIFRRHAIRSITVVHMEVPCCSGVRYVVGKALEKAGKKIPVTDTTITIDGGYGEVFRTGAGPGDGGLLVARTMEAMIRYFGTDVRRINHALKVDAFSRIIGSHAQPSPGLQEVLSCTALLHDIGIHEAERKYHSTAGKYQQIEGPPVARRILLDLGAPAPLIDRVCFITGNHHTYPKIDGTDFQILVEADFLVNIFEDALERAAIESIHDRIFRNGIRRDSLRTMYLS